MSSLKLGFCLGFFQREGVGLEDLLSEAHKIGYEGVDIGWLDESFRGTAETILDHGLRVSAMCGHQLLSDGLNDPGNHDRIEAEIAEAIEIAAEYDIPTVICFSGNRHGREDEESIATCAAGLRRVAPAAEGAGVNLCLELLNSKVNHPGYQCDHTAWGVRVVEAVGPPNVMLLYDIYHMQIMEGDLIRTITDNIAHIGHFHTGGNPGRHDLDGEQEINYPAVCAAIRGAGYDGFVMHEFSPKGDPIQAVEAAYRTCSA